MDMTPFVLINIPYYLCLTNDKMKPEEGTEMIVKALFKGFDKSEIGVTTWPNQPDMVSLLVQTDLVDKLTFNLKQMKDTHV